MIPAESASTAPTMPMWSGMTGMAPSVLRVYDDPKSTQPPLKALDPYNKKEVTAEAFEERKRAQRVDPQEVARNMGVSDAVGSTKASQIVLSVVQSMQRYRYCFTSIPLLCLFKGVCHRLWMLLLYYFDVMMTLR